MDTKTISTIQCVIAIAAIVYVVCPDFFIGPIDDAAVAAVATFADIFLGIAKSHITVEPSTDRDTDF